MKLFFDNEIVTLKDKDSGFILYSPLVHKRIRVNKAVFLIIEDVLKNNGEIDFPAIKGAVSKEFGVTPSNEDILSQIEDLKKLNMLFDDEKTKKGLVGAVNAKIVNDIQQSDLSTAYLHLTMRCNFNCAYCYNRAWEKDFSKELSTEEWLEVANKLSKTGIKQVNVTGGEALVRKDCGAILKKLSELKFRVTLLTNGSLLQEKYDEVLPYVNSIVLSLDSENAHTNELNRSAVGFNKIFQAIKRITAEFPEKLVVRSVINANNINEVKEFHKKLKTDYGVRHTIKTMFLPNRAEEIEQVPNPETMKTISDTEIGESDIYYRCSAGKKIIALSPSGDIFPCQSLMYPELKMGNIFDSNWHEQVKENAATLMPKLLGEKSGCADCQVRHFCGSGCPAISYRLHGEFARKLDFLCPHLKEQAKCRLENMKPNWEEFQGYQAAAAAQEQAGHAA